MDLSSSLQTAPPTVLIAAFLVIVIASLVVGRLISNSFPGKKPPVFEGIPFIGGLLKFAGGPWGLLEKGYKQCGEVFTVPVAHWNITFLIGPDVAPHFFKASDEELSQAEVYGFSVPTFGPGVVYDADLKTRVEQYRMFSDALKTDRLKKYVPQFVMEAEQYFASWGETGEVDLQIEFSKLIINTAARTLMGREIRETLFDQTARLLHDLDVGMQPISVVFPFLPIPVHRQRDKARMELRAIFDKVITARRSDPNPESDVLQSLIEARYQNGRALTNSEITGMLIAILFAGQHTSSITSSWSGYHMIEAKSTWMAAAVDEQKQIMKKFGSELSFEALSEMDVLHRNITEALRMHPPLILVMRYVKQAFTVTTSQGKEVYIPKGHVVASSPNFQHMLPTVFPNPEKYDPARFAPPREEDRKKPYSFLGFGGGRHACMGQNFAYLQIKTIWSHLLRNFDFELLTPIPEPDYEGMVVGPKPGKVRYTRRKIQA